MADGQRLTVSHYGVPTRVFGGYNKYGKNDAFRAQTESVGATVTQLSVPTPIPGRVALASTSKPFRQRLVSLLQA